MKTISLNASNDFDVDIYNSQATTALVVVHGASEGKSRYTQFAERLSSDYAVIVYNHPSHETGRPVSFNHLELLKRTEVVIGYAQENYDNVVIFGHSMGSIVVRNLLYKIKPTTKIILSGAPVIGTIDRISSYLGLIPLMFMNMNAVSPFFNKLVFDQKSEKIGLDNKKWISSQQAIVDQFVNSELNNQQFTNGSLKALINLTLKANTKVIYQQLAGYQLFLVSGICDSFTNNGINYQKIAKYNNEIEIKIYPNSYHEVHNDIDKMQLDKDIRLFIEKEQNGKN